VAIAALVVALGGAAYAAIPDGSGVITGCYDGGGNLKVIDTASAPSCPKGYTTVTWNQSGRQGPQGAPGISNYQIVTASLVWSGIQTYPQTVSCPTGDKALSGGWQSWAPELSGINATADMMSAPTGDGSGWVFNTNAFEVTWPVYVICATVQTGS
jgi:hypothetical protein